MCDFRASGIAVSGMFNPTGGAELLHRRDPDISCQNPSHCGPTLTIPTPTIQDYEDYREFLLDLYRWKKNRNPRFSYRLMAIRIGMDAARLHKVLHGQGYFVRGTSSRIAASLGLDESQARELQWRIDLVGAPAIRTASRTPMAMVAMAG